jgi:ATP synthase protein I
MHPGNIGKDDNHRSNHDRIENDKAMGRRLADLKARIDKMSPDEEKALQNAAPMSTKRQSIGRALRLGTDLVAGVAVGGLIGFWLDRWFDTKPVWFIIFFLLGTAAGFLNVFRTAQQIQEEQNDQVRQGKLGLGYDLHDNEDDD